MVQVIKTKIASPCKTNTVACNKVEHDSVWNSEIKHIGLGRNFSTKVSICGQDFEQVSELHVWVWCMREWDWYQL